MRQLSIHGSYWCDNAGRRHLLRGVNLSGSTKLPFGLTTRDPQLLPPGAISFVGRPFPEDQADEHFARLRHWGFNCLRFLTTWEAVEPDEPGRYDERYLDYLRRMVKKAGDYGLYVFLDPHQDAWSRFSGGDGAPRWTLDLAGFAVDRLDASEAAITMAPRYPSDYAGMIWPNNWLRLASATMFTLFFAGERLAPQCKVGHESIQTYLQRHFCAAMAQAASRLADLDHVLGYDSLNEPNGGFIGIANLNKPLTVYNHGPQLTGFDSLSIPAGFSKVCPVVHRDGVRQYIEGTAMLNLQGVSAWRSPSADIWRAHGVWDVKADQTPHLLRPDYFAKVKFHDDCLRPFVSRYGTAIRQVHPGSALFIEGEPGGPEGLSADPADAPVVNASHWYDLLTLITKHYNPERAMVWGSTKTVRGAEQVRRSFHAQIAAHVAESKAHLGGAPTLIGEFGVPFDMDDGASFKSGDFSPQEAALTAYYDALDASLAHATLWNYTPDNNNLDGDLWNREDLSIYSSDQSHAPSNHPLDRGGRAIKGFCRPTVRAARGLPRRQELTADGRFILELDRSQDLGHGPEPTLVFAPLIHYPAGPVIAVSEGHATYDRETQLISWIHADLGASSQSPAFSSLVLTCRPS